MQINTHSHENNKNRHSYKMHFTKCIKCTKICKLSDVFYNYIASLANKPILNQLLFIRELENTIIFGLSKIKTI